jgi:branched-subunit amino acid aminotransferase/4-amino-4-deoxychorismate lyase
LVCECSSANIFVRKAGDIYTPPVVDGPLQGSIRHLIVHELKVAKERSMKIEDLSEADEVFITSVGRVVQSVSSIHGIANYYSKQSAGSILNHIYGLLNE